MGKNSLFSGNTHTHTHPVIFGLCLEWADLENYNYIVSAADIRILRVSVCEYECVLREIPHPPSNRINFYDDSVIKQKASTIL